MSSTRKRKSRRGWDDPSYEMVPVLGHRVQAVLDQNERHRKSPASPSELARLTGDSQQTMSLICSGITKTARRFRVERIAEVLGPSFEWFTDESKLLYGVHYAEDEQGRLLADPEKPAATQLAASRWYSAVDEAHERDSGPEGPQSLEEELEYYKELFALRLLTRPNTWRGLLLEDNEYFGGEWVYDGSQAEAAVLLTDAMLIILRPWLEGQSRLDKNRLHDMMSDPVSLTMQLIEKKGSPWYKNFKKQLTKERRAKQRAKKRKASIKHKKKT